MHFFISLMDAVLVDFDENGKVRFEEEDWSAPSLQERRAILYAAQNLMSELRELVDVLERDRPPH